jgi:exocyst complex component 4
MEVAMNKIVDEYFQGFNTSIRNYSGILNNVNSSQRSVQLLKKDLEKTRSYLASRSRALKTMWKQNVEYAETIKILEKM